MKLISICLLGLVLIAGCSSTWSAKDKKLALTYTALTSIDAMQTKKILRDDKLKEKNPLIKNDKSLLFVKSGCLLTGFCIADQFPKARPYILWFGILSEVACIRNNHQLGVRIGF